MKNLSSIIVVPLAIGSIVALSYASAQKGGMACCGDMSAKQHDAHHGTAFQAKQLNDKQTATVTVDNGYSPAVIEVKLGKPVELTFTGGKNIGCGGTVVFKSLKVNKDVATGKSVVFKFTPTKKGEIPFTCSMGMLQGKVVVK